MLQNITADDISWIKSKNLLSSTTGKSYYKQRMENLTSTQREKWKKMTISLSAVVNVSRIDQRLKTVLIPPPHTPPPNAHIRRTATQNAIWHTLSKCLSETSKSHVNRSRGLWCFCFCNRTATRLRGWLLRAASSRRMWPLWTQGRYTLRAR